jgi:hypothetical protein
MQYCISLVLQRCLVQRGRKMLHSLINERPRVYIHEKCGGYLNKWLAQDVTYLTDD